MKDKGKSLLYSFPQFVYLFAYFLFIYYIFLYMAFVKSNIFADSF